MLTLKAWSLSEKISPQQWRRVYTTCLLPPQEKDFQDGNLLWPNLNRLLTSINRKEKLLNIKSKLKNYKNMLIKTTKCMVTKWLKWAINSFFNKECSMEVPILIVVRLTTFKLKKHKMMKICSNRCSKWNNFREIVSIGKMRYIQWIFRHLRL